MTCDFLLAVRGETARVAMVVQRGVRQPAPCLHRDVACGVHSVWNT
jgi:hypothetical protein